MIIDSHCHLEYDPLFGDLENILNRALKNDVRYFLTISTTNASYVNILKIISKYKYVYGTYGIHPHESKSNHNIDKNFILEKIKNKKKIIGIGETGLDFYYENSEKHLQEKLFIEHIHAAQESQLPLIIHTRSAEDKTLEILKRELKKKPFKILIHCFTGSEDFAFKLIDLGCYISASGIITFKNSTNLADTFKKLPIDKILVETDSPYLAPVPHRGKPNEPSFILHTIDFLAKIRNVDIKKLSDITSSNFLKLFGALEQ